jgi:hypothetical protein
MDDRRGSIASTTCFGAGTDHIVFTYDPSSFRLGWMISLGAVVVLLITVGVGLPRRRRTAARHARSTTSPAPA